MTDGNAYTAMNGSQASIGFVMLYNVTSALSGYISDMNYSSQESHNRDSALIFSNDQQGSLKCQYHRQ